MNVFQDFLCNRIGDSKSTQEPFEINLLTTLAFRSIGSSYSAMKDWCGTMNIPHCVTKDTFGSIQRKINSGCRTFFGQMTAKTV